MKKKITQYQGQVLFNLITVNSDIYILISSTFKEIKHGNMFKLILYSYK